MCVCVRVCVCFYNIAKHDKLKVFMFFFQDDNSGTLEVESNTGKVLTAACDTTTFSAA